MAPMFGTQSVTFWYQRETNKIIKRDRRARRTSAGARSVKSN